MKERLNTETGEHSGASHCSEFILLMGQIECMMERAAIYHAEAQEEGDVETAGKNGRVYCVLKELHRLGKCFEERETTRRLSAINDMLPIVQAVAGKGPLVDDRWNLKAFAEDALAIHFPNAGHHLPPDAKR